MKPSEALLLNRIAVLNAAKQFRTTNVRVFGSVLRRSDAEASDLDLLVDVLPGATLFDLGGLQDKLQEMLGLQVDLVTSADLPQKFRASVLAEAQPI